MSSAVVEHPSIKIVEVERQRALRREDPAPADVLHDGMRVCPHVLRPHSQIPSYKEKGAEFERDVKAMKKQDNNDHKAKTIDPKNVRTPSEAMQAIQLNKGAAPVAVVPP